MIIQLLDKVNMIKFKAIVKHIRFIKVIQMIRIIMELIKLVRIDFQLKNFMVKIIIRFKVRMNFELSKVKNIESKDYCNLSS
jgi:hypothetical protein